MSNEQFTEEYIPQSNWMKFEKVGDYLKGTFVSKSLREASDDFPEQTVYELTNCEAVVGGEKVELETDDSMMVGISRDFVNQRLKRVEPGRRIGLKFEKEIPATRKGFSPAKSIMPYIWEIDQSFKVREEFGGEELSADEIPFD